jgi:hypothetical protein
MHPGIIGIIMYDKYSTDNTSYPTTILRTPYNLVYSKNYSEGQVQQKFTFDRTIYDIISYPTTILSEYNYQCVGPCS